MKGKELLETYPRIAEVIRNWYSEKMLKQMEVDTVVPEDFKRYMKARGVTDEALVTIIDKSPAMLFEIFDSVHVYIGIVVSELPETEKAVFNYYICPKGKCLDTSPQEFLSRKDVEHYAMLATIEYIDNNFEEFFPSKSYEEEKR